MTTIYKLCSEESTAGEAICVAAFVTPECLDETTARVTGRLGEAFQTAATHAEFAAEPGQVHWVDTADGARVAMVGVGPRGAVTPGVLRAAGGSLAWAMEEAKPGRVTIADPLGVLAIGDAAGVRAVGAVATGLVLGGFTIDRYKHGDAAKGHAVDLCVDMFDDAMRVVFERAMEDAHSVNVARALAAAPPNLATPQHITDHARQLADSHALKCVVLDVEQMRERKMAGLLAVAGASRYDPRLIEMVYEPPIESGKVHDPPTLLLIGKTVTFDTGGLSLKTPAGMRGMKYDKAGGCAVLGAMHAVSRLAPPMRVVAILPACENAVGSHAYRPDDILQFPNGLNVEITDTDYEGRLTLADALVYGCREHGPDAVIEMGTLTGETIAALGRETAGLWCGDVALREAIGRAAEATGDAVWAMPLTDEHHRLLHSHHADLKNIDPDAPGRSGQCAAFLSRFVPEGVPWAHLDIAGPVEVVEDRPPYRVGPTGWGAGLLMHVMRHFVPSVRWGHK